MLKAFLAGFLSFVFVIVSLAEEHSKIHQPTLAPQNSGTLSGLIAVSPVNSRVVWASGRDGRLRSQQMVENTGRPELCLELKRCSSAVSRGLAKRWHT
jgi:hypothetical protein